MTAAARVTVATGTRYGARDPPDCRGYVALADRPLSLQNGLISRTTFLETRRENRSCRIEDAASSYTYALSCMASTVVAIVNLAPQFDTANWLGASAKPNDQQRRMPSRAPI